MKTFLLLFLFLSVTVASSQNKEPATNQPDTRLVGQTIRKNSALANKPKGSPYSQNMFIAAKVKNITNATFVRYNIFADEFEFITPKNDTLIMDKLEDFGTISLNGSNKKYTLSTYTKNGKLFYGYLIPVYEKGNYGILRKENITFYEEKPAKTSLEVTQPARYSKIDDTWFLKSEKSITEFPENKKQLIKLYPTKKEAIESFLKENKLSFDEENGRIKLVDFLTNL